MSRAPLSLLVIVTGLPCTGKTTLARQLAAEFHLPLVCKDDLKEILFDNLGWSDRAWSKKLGGAVYELMCHLVQVELSVGRSLVVESNFRGELETPRLRNLRERYPSSHGKGNCRPLL